MNDKGQVYVSWAVTLIMALALLLQSFKGARVASPLAPQEMELVAENPGVPPNVKVWQFKDPVTGERVMVMTGRVSYYNSTEVKRVVESKGDGK